MSIAGVVRYQVQPDGSLDGRWTHSDLGGRIAAERASGGTPGQLAGSYAVEIHAPEGEKLYEGELVIQPFAESYTLAWSGYLLIPVREPATFSGIGMLEGEVLISTFQKDTAPLAAG
jgi:hypothetical protein